MYPWEGGTFPDSAMLNRLHHRPPILHLRQDVSESGVLDISLPQAGKTQTVDYLCVGEW